MFSLSATPSASTFHEPDNAQSVIRRISSFPLFNSTYPRPTNPDNSSPQSTTYVPNLPIPTTNSDYTYTSRLWNKSTSTEGSSTSLEYSYHGQWEYEHRGHHNSQIVSQSFQSGEESANAGRPTYHNLDYWNRLSDADYRAYKHTSRQNYMLNSTRGPNSVLDDFSPYYSPRISNPLKNDNDKSNQSYPNPSSNASSGISQEKPVPTQNPETKVHVPILVDNDLSKPDEQVKKCQCFQMEKQDSKDNAPKKKRGRKPKVVSDQAKNEALVSLPGGAPLFTVALQTNPPIKKKRGRPFKIKPPLFVLPASVPIVAPQPTNNECGASHNNLPQNAPLSKPKSLPRSSKKLVRNNWDSNIRIFQHGAYNAKQATSTSEHIVPINHGTNTLSVAQKFSHSQRNSVVDAPTSKTPAKANTKNEARDKRTIAFEKEKTKVNQSSSPNAPLGSERLATAKDAPIKQISPNQHTKAGNLHLPSKQPSGLTFSPDVRVQSNKRPIFTTHSKSNREDIAFQNTKKMLRDDDKEADLYLTDENEKESAPCGKLLPKPRSKYHAVDSASMSSGSQDTSERGKGGDQVVKDAPATPFNMKDPISLGVINIFDILTKSNEHSEQEDTTEIDSLSDVEEMINFHLPDGNQTDFDIPAKVKTVNLNDAKTSSSTIVRPSNRTYTPCFLSDESDDDSKPENEHVGSTNTNTLNDKTCPSNGSEESNNNFVAASNSTHISSLNPGRGIQYGSLTDSVVGSNVESIFVSSRSNGNNVTENNMELAQAHEDAPHKRQLCHKENWDQRLKCVDQMVPIPPTSTESILLDDCLWDRKSPFVSFWQEITKFNEEEVKVEMRKKYRNKRKVSSLSTPIPTWKCNPDERTSAFVTICNLSLQEAAGAENALSLPLTGAGPYANLNNLAPPAYACIAPHIILDGSFYAKSRTGKHARTTTTPTYGRQNRRLNKPQWLEDFLQNSPVSSIDYNQSEVEEENLAPSTGAEFHVGNGTFSCGERGRKDPPHVPKQPGRSRQVIQNTLESAHTQEGVSTSSQSCQDDISTPNTKQRISRCHTNPMIKKLVKFAKSQNPNYGLNKTKSKLNADLNKVFRLGWKKPKRTILGSGKSIFTEIMLEIPGPIERRARVSEFPKIKKDETNMNKGNRNAIQKKFCVSDHTPTLSITTNNGNAKTTAQKRVPATKPLDKNPKASCNLSEDQNGLQRKRQKKKKAAKTISRKPQEVVTGNTTTVCDHFDDSDPDILDIHAERDLLLDMFCNERD